MSRENFNTWVEHTVARRDTIRLFLAGTSDPEKRAELNRIKQLAARSDTALGCWCDRRVAEGCAFSLKTLVQTAIKNWDIKVKIVFCKHVWYNKSSNIETNTFDHHSDILRGFK